MPKGTAVSHIHGVVSCVTDNPKCIHLPILVLLGMDIVTLIVTHIVFKLAVIYGFISVTPHSVKISSQLLQWKNIATYFWPI